MKTNLSNKIILFQWHCKQNDIEGILINIFIHTLKSQYLQQHPAEQAKQKVGVKQGSRVGLCNHTRKISEKYFLFLDTLYCHFLLELWTIHYEL
jgi:hypothetical protein